MKTENIRNNNYEHPNYLLGSPIALYYTKYNTNLTINQPLNNGMQNMQITRIIPNIFLVL